MKTFFVLLLLLTGQAVLAEVMVPVRTIRVREVIVAEDLVRKSTKVTGALSDPSEIIGQEARIVLYPGRPIRLGDVGPPAIISRNDTVTLIFSSGTLRIATEGRALGRGAIGESIRAMNLASRATVMGRILEDGTIEVQ